LETPDLQDTASTVVDAADKRWKKYDDVIDDISCVIVRIPEAAI